MHGLLVVLSRIASLIRVRSLLSHADTLGIRYARMSHASSVTRVCRSLVASQASGKDEENAGREKREGKRSPRVCFTLDPTKTNMTMPAYMLAAVH